MLRKPQLEINAIKHTIIEKIKNLNLTVNKADELGRSSYSINNAEILIDICYASLGEARNEYFFGIEQEQFQSTYKNNRNLYVIFICGSENLVFIVPASVMIEILQDDKATDHGNFKQWKIIIRQRNGIFELRFFGTYDITKHLNRYDYLTNDIEKSKIVQPVISYNTDIRIETTEQRWETLLPLLPLTKAKTMHNATVEMLKCIGEWYGYKVLTETYPINLPNFPYKVDCLWYKNEDLFLAIEVCDSGQIEKDKDSLKLAKAFGARKVIIITDMNKVDRVRKLFMYNGEIKSWTEVWTFNRVFDMFETGSKFFKDFSKFKGYAWNENLVEFL
jgi:hypothetical protein